MHVDKPPKLIVESYMVRGTGFLKQPCRDAGKQGSQSTELPQRSLQSPVVLPIAASWYRGLFFID